MTRPCWTTLALGLVVAFAAGRAVAADGLEAGFRSPPHAARPWVYWDWKNGNISRAGITADFEALHRTGIGGVLLMEVDLGIPAGPVKFMSPQWRQLFKHAVGEAQRLGMEFSLMGGPGWCGSGGPWITPEQSMQHLVASAVEVAGPSKYSAVLPRPSPRRFEWGTGGLPPALVEARNAFYADVAVLAFPKPAVPAAIADIKEKALYHRGYFTSQRGVKPCLPMPASFPVLPPGAAIARDRVVDLTDRLQPDGRLDWDVPPGAWTILRFGRTSTGASSRPGPSTGIGLECDKFDPSALDAHFENYIAVLMKECGLSSTPRQTGWTMVQLDSWESNAQNWTPKFREEFRRRRGYDPLAYLPAITGRAVDTLEISERFLWDLRQTAQELLVENHGRRMGELARRHGFRLSIEPYDSMFADDMTFGAAADVPMGEFWCNTFDARFSVKEATSIGHVYGKPIIAAEAFTSVDNWRLHPGAVKALGDWALSEGVNRLVIHGCVHQPFLHIRPGLSLGPHGLHYDRTQTWWELTPPWHLYLARCQHLLQQGQWVADVLYLSPEGAPNVFQRPTPEPAGYKYDACTPEALVGRVSVQDGKLVLPEGRTYRMLLLPRMGAMTPPLARRVSSLADRGATVVGLLPDKSPSLSGYPQCDAAVKAIAASFSKRPDALRLAGPSSAAGLYPAGADIEKLLRASGVAPDFEGGPDLRFAHRRVGEAEVYFVSNGKAAEVEAGCTFRVAGRAPELWQPETGQIRPLPCYRATDDGRTVVPLRLGPEESFFVVFRGRAPAPGKAGAADDNFPRLQPAGEIKGPWQVAFDPKWGGPEKPVAFEKLDDWTARPEPGIRHYSGTAVYRTTFEHRPVESAGTGRRYWLHLGTVREYAQVRLNGKELGIAWKSPFRFEATGALRPGANAMEVRVTNLWPNRMIGDELLAPDSDRRRNGNLKSWPAWLVEGKPSPTGRYTFTHWRPWKATDRLLPSGLLGPVQLETTGPGG